MTEAVEITSPNIPKQAIISKLLRKEIIEGRLGPGVRIPTQIQLVEQFGVSGVTIQRALDRLIREGFIYTRGRNGTFVATHPPHLYSYGVVFRDSLKVGRSRYHQMLEAQALRLAQSGDRKVSVFSRITGQEDSEPSGRLLSMVRSHQLAGLFLIDGDAYINTPLMDEEGIFRCAIMSRKVDSLNCPIVYPELTAMIDLALDTLVKRGRTRVAALITTGVYAEVGHYLREAMRERGITTKDQWLQIVPHDIPEAVRNNVLMLMSGHDRPDGLFIVDDNLAEGASCGLVMAGISVPRDVEVVAHCNFPWLAPSVLPLHLVGFDTAQIIKTAVEVIDRQRQGERVPNVIRIPAILKEAQHG